MASFPKWTILLLAPAVALCLCRAINTTNYKAQTMLLSTPPLYKLMVKGGADVREKKEINVKTGNQIRIARESAGLTQDRFAEMVSLAIIFPPMTACNGITNNCLGITSFNFSTIFLPLS